MTNAPAGTAQGKSAMSLGQTSKVLAGLGLATWMEFYTYESVNLILPDIAGSLGVSQDQASWILTSYSSSLFLGIPLSIWLAGYLGHLRYILGSSMVFVVASIGCTFAFDLESMIFWRIVQGFAGAGLTVWWRASIYLLVPRPQRSHSLMRISVMLYLASAVGLLFSGYVTDNMDWRLIFLPNIVFVSAAVYLLAAHFPTVPRSNDPRGSSIDKRGIILLAIGLVSLQLVLSRGEIEGWSDATHIQVLAWTSFVSMTLFIAWQFSQENKGRLLRLDLIRDRNLMAAVVLGIFAGIILSGSIYALPEFLRTVDPRMLSATQTGQIMCVYALTAAIIRPIVTKGIARFGQRKALCFSLIMLILSMLLAARLITTVTPEVEFALPLILYAFCLAPLLSAIGGGTVAKLEPADQMDGVSIYMTCRQLGASFGVTLVTLILDHREQLHSSRMFEHLRSGASAIQNRIDDTAQVIGRSGLAPQQSYDAALAILAKQSGRQAATLAYADAFLCMAAVGAIALCFVPLMSPTPVVRK